MKTRMICSRMSIAILVTVTLLSPCADATSQEPRFADAARRGKVVQLPDANSGDQRNRLLAGHVHLLNKTIEQAIEDLQHGELREFLKSYRRMVDSYGQLSDHVADAAASIGAAEAQVGLAKRSLTRLDEKPSNRNESRQQLREDLGQVRALLIGRLATLRQQFVEAGQDEQKELMSQIQGLVGRVRQLDQLKSSLNQGSRPLLPGLAAGDLHRQLDVIGQALDEEQRTLGVVARSVGLLVDSTTADMQRTVRLLQIQTSIPREQLAQLAETRKAVQSVLDEVLQAHAVATKSAQNILSAADASAITDDPEQLLREVDRLLEDGAEQGDH